MVGYSKRGCTLESDACPVDLVVDAWAYLLYLGGNKRVSSKIQYTPKGGRVSIANAAAPPRRAK